MSEQGQDEASLDGSAINLRVAEMANERHCRELALALGWDDFHTDDPVADWRHLLELVTARQRLWEAYSA